MDVFFLTLGWLVLIDYVRRFLLQEETDEMLGHDGKIIKNRADETCPYVDVVYTWVNGSDPAHKALLKQYNKKWDAGFREYGLSQT